MLVNSIIKNTPAQADLIALQQYSGFLDDLGVIGTGYWRGFMKRNKDKIVSKKGKSLR